MNKIRKNLNKILDKYPLAYMFYATRDNDIEKRLADELETYINKAVKQAYKSGYIQASIEYTKDEVIKEESK